jgi:hypothetical protein
MLHGLCAKNRGAPARLCEAMLVPIERGGWVRPTGRGDEATLAIS